MGLIAYIVGYGCLLNGRPVRLERQSPCDIWKKFLFQARLISVSLSSVRICVRTRINPSVGRLVVNFFVEFKKDMGEV